MTSSSSSTQPVEQLQQQQAALPETKVEGQDTSGRLLQPIELNFNKTISLFNKEATSENTIVAGLEKVAYKVAGVFTAVFEAVVNFFAGLYNFTIVPSTNLVGRLIQKAPEAKAEAPEEVQEEAPTEEAEEVELPVVVEQTRAERIKETVKAYASTAANAVADASSKAWNFTSEKAAGAWASIKAHPYRTAAVVAAGITSAAGTAVYLKGLPALPSILAFRG